MILGFSNLFRQLQTNILPISLKLHSPRTSPWQEYCRGNDKLPGYLMLVTGDTPWGLRPRLSKAPFIYGSQFTVIRTQGHTDFCSFLVYIKFYLLVQFDPPFVNARQYMSVLLENSVQLTLSCYEEDRTGWDMNRHPVFVKQMGLTVQKRLQSHLLSSGLGVYSMFKRSHIGCLNISIYQNAKKMVVKLGTSCFKNKMFKPLRKRNTLLPECASQWQVGFIRPLKIVSR